MCGIVGYVGEQSASGIIIEGLRRMEYRGYDSAGIAMISEGSIVSDKKAGKLANLVDSLAENPLPKAQIGIGHTRWATHGPPNDVNAHPHLGQQRRVAVVHNGIIENFTTLREELESDNADLISETDTEIAAHLLERTVAETGDLTTAMQQVCRRLEGAFTLVAIDANDPERVVAARRNSPLVVGLGQGENFLGSDVAAFIEHTRDALELAQDQVVTITRDSVEVTDFDGTPATGKQYYVDWDLSAAEKGGYDWGFLAYCVGYGGSMLWFGSSSGVAVANIFSEAKSVGKWLLHGWHIPLGYLAGFFALLMMVGWNPKPV